MVTACENDCKQANGISQITMHVNATANATAANGILAFRVAGTLNALLRYDKRSCPTVLCSNKIVSGAARTYSSFLTSR